MLIEVHCNLFINMHYAAHHILPK